MQPAQHTEAAQLLLGAYSSRTPVAPLVQTYPELDLTDAYRIQAVQIQAWQSEGRRVVGRKIGLTSPAMRQQLGVDEPDHGVLREDMVHGDGAVLDMGAFIAPRVEPEIAFVLGADLRGPGCTIEAAAAAVDHLLPSLEIIDSRIADWRITIGDTIADNASSGAVVLGATPVRLAADELPAVACELRCDGAVVASGTADAVLGNPLRALAWLADTLAEFDTGLEAGQVVIPGSITAAQPVAAGQSWSATFTGIGTVTARFVDGHQPKEAA